MGNERAFQRKKYPTPSAVHPPTVRPVSPVAGRVFPAPLAAAEIQGDAAQANTYGHSLQRMAVQRPEHHEMEEHTAKQTANATSLPNQLKASIEHLSGMSLDDVRVHYNSPRPAQVQALAYTQGTEIHVGPGQEQHLPHEAWHVVQQKQGRVLPTMQAQGVAINDEQKLEHEADVMGYKARESSPRCPVQAKRTSPRGTVQRMAVIQRAEQHDSDQPGSLLVIPQVNAQDPPPTMEVLHYPYKPELFGKTSGEGKDLPAFQVAYSGEEKNETTMLGKVIAVIKELEGTLASANNPETLQNILDMKTILQMRRKKTLSLQKDWVLAWCKAALNIIEKGEDKLKGEFKDPKGLNKVKNLIGSIHVYINIQNDMAHAYNAQKNQDQDADGGKGLKEEDQNEPDTKKQRTEPVVQSGPVQAGIMNVTMLRDKSTQRICGMATWTVGYQKEPQSADGIYVHNITVDSGLGGSLFGSIVKHAGKGRIYLHALTKDVEALYRKIYGAKSIDEERKE